MNKEERIKALERKMKYLEQDIVLTRALRPVEMKYHLIDPGLNDSEENRREAKKEGFEFKEYLINYHRELWIKKEKDGISKNK